MTTEKADDDLDALEALDTEAKEFNKVISPLYLIPVSVANRFDY